MSQEEDFTLVIPSNCQPVIFTDNTASLFSTQLEHAKTLDGQWDVALKDLSLVNTLQTFKNEKISVNQVSTETLKEVTWFNEELEDQHIIKAFNLRRHSEEWESNVVSSEMAWLSYIHEQLG